MTEDRARQVANVVMAAVAVGAAVFVLRTPKLRRMAWQLARQYAAGPLGAWAATTMRDAWDHSAAAGPALDRSTATAAPRLPAAAPRAAGEGSPGRAG